MTRTRILLWSFFHIFSISLFFHEPIRVPNGPPPEAFVPVPVIASARRRLWDVPRWKASRVQAGEGWVGFRSTFPFLEPQGQPFINGCFNWMIPNLYIGNGWKSPFPSIYKWLFQLDDSKSLHRKWLEITKHLFINGWKWGSRLGIYLRSTPHPGFQSPPGLLHF